MTAAQRLVRLAAAAVVRAPWLWPVVRPALRRLFDRLAPRWDALRSPGRTTVLEAALARLVLPPRRALDVGTGTGDAALAVARRWPQAEVLGVDLSPRMVAEARAKTPAALAGRVRFAVADARRLPVEDGWADLLVLNNMIPFPAELARAAAPGGSLVVAFSQGASTPIYVSPARLRRELARHGFLEPREVRAGPGWAIVARRAGAR